MTRIIEHGRVLICIRASAIICCMHLAAPFIELNILGSINARIIEDILRYIFAGEWGSPSAPTTLICMPIGYVFTHTSCCSV